MSSVNTIEGVNGWFSKAVPVPTSQNISTQIGVHMEEVAEFFKELKVKNNPMLEVALNAIVKGMENLAAAMKESDCIEIPLEKRLLVLDALCDQIVTAVGVANYAGMDIAGGLAEVNRSNWSKFDADGNPIFDENLKIIKGPDYQKPVLTLFV